MGLHLPLLFVHLPLFRALTPSLNLTGQDQQCLQDGAFSLQGSMFHLFNMHALDAHILSKNEIPFNKLFIMTQFNPTAPGNISQELKSNTV